jgi:general secretion pathway protein M
MNALRERWAALAARERLLVVVAGSVIALALLWLVALQPALKVLRTAPAAHAELDRQTQAMQRLAAEARGLRAAPPLAPGLAAQALQGATQRLGPAGRLVLQGDRAVLTLNGVHGDSLAQWLAEARNGARARPVEAKLTFGEEGYKGSLVVVIGGARP